MRRTLTLIMLLGLAACAPRFSLPSLPSDTSQARVPGMERAATWTYRDDTVYFEVGGQGRPVLLLHGLEPGMDSFNVWQRNTTALLDAGYRVYALDFTGYGRSERDARRLTDGYFLGLVTTFLERVVAEPAVVMAMGRSAAYAIDIAANRPDLVAGLVLNAPSGYEVFPSVDDADIAFNRLISGGGLFSKDVYEARSSLGGISGFLRDKVYLARESIAPEVLASYYYNLRPTGSDWAVYSLESGSLNHSVDAVWPRVRQPALLLWGLENPLIPLESAEAFLSARPQTEFKVLTGSRLAVQDERGLNYNAFVVEFLLRSFPPR